jgi:hypothetical protein
MKKLRDKNIVKAKEIATSHINVAYYITNSMRNLDYNQIYKIEGQCIVNESKVIKDIPRILEAKMTK